MCGIGGIFSYSSNPIPDLEERLNLMGDQMIFRGPDDSRIWMNKDQNFGFVHRRLSVIDLSDTGAQPMFDPTLRFSIIFNGEIYNHQELRVELTKSGAKFVGSSDTEVILKLYIQYGKDCTRYLNGMYAIAIWDNLKQELFLSRDQFGIKPLYLLDNGSEIIFASQVKALSSLNLNLKIDPIGAAEFWVWGHIPEPRTIYKNIVSLEAGSSLIISKQKNPRLITNKNIWSTLEPENSAQKNQTNLSEVLLDVVNRQLISDVPTGIFLSGGIDSSVLAIMAKRSNRNVNTLTIAFHEYRGTPLDESPLAEKLAMKMGFNHQTIWINSDYFLEIFDDYLAAMDLPTIDGINTFLISKVAKDKGFKVVLSGLGADEMFGGYKSFRDVPALRTLGKFLSLNKFTRESSRKILAPILRGITHPKYASIFEYGGSWSNAYMLKRALHLPWEKNLLNEESFQINKIIRQGLDDIELNLSDDRQNKLLENSKNSFAVISYLELTHYMKSRLLRDADWASMAHSIELRVPYLDDSLLEAVGQKIQTGKPWTKKDLAYTALPELTEDHLRKKKTGFEVPIKGWIKAKYPNLLHTGNYRNWSNIILEQYLNKNNIY